MRISIVLGAVLILGGTIGLALISNFSKRSVSQPEFVSAIAETAPVEAVSRVEETSPQVLTNVPVTVETVTNVTENALQVLGFSLKGMHPVSVK